MCPSGFTPHGPNGGLNLNNQVIGVQDFDGTITECGALCENTVDCLSFEYYPKAPGAANGYCQRHSMVSRDERNNPAGWIACVKDGKISLIVLHNLN